MAQKCCTLFCHPNNNCHLACRLKLSKPQPVILPQLASCQNVQLFIPKLTSHTSWYKLNRSYGFHKLKLHVTVSLWQSQIVSANLLPLYHRYLQVFCSGVENLSLGSLTSHPKSAIHKNKICKWFHYVFSIKADMFCSNST